MSSEMADGPPRNYDQWYTFAKRHECLIDEYAQIQRDFEPFYQLAQKDPKFFAKMAGQGYMGLRTFKVEKKVASTTDDFTSNYERRISASLPDMNLVFNHRDEPRVAFDARIPNTLNEGLAVDDVAPFFNQPPAPPPSSTRTKSTAFSRAGPNGFLTYANDANSFLLYSASADFTTDLYPVLSQTKIYPCFADILFPSEFHYPRAYNSPSTRTRTTSPGRKEARLILARTIHRRVDLRRQLPLLPALPAARRRAHPRRAGLMDVAISVFYAHYCGLEGCDAERIKAEYKHLRRGRAARGRVPVQSGSLVFKSTIFAEYFDEWLQPFVHYIPVLPDLSDLARRIQQAGQEFVERVITDAQNDCYFFLVLLEWARLQSGGR
ncbi:hypothetical protein B0H14DRAFT_3491349 [Mycena olivaceomarginata]|nr:hypothetical protein B0H14DRAFT_3491349 [Mycena olivaceomarginata]